MIIGRQSGLGRGLGALIPPKPTPTPSGSQAMAPAPAPVHEDFSPIQVSQPDPVEQEVSRQAEPVEVRPNTREVHMIPVELIDPNPHQPRTVFDHSQLEDLISSIKAHGVMQPIVVTPAAGGRYELIAGERRLRASKVAGLERIPALVRTATEQQKLELAIIENIQRSNLNPIEEANAYLRLQAEFNLTQDEVGIKVGKSRPQVANIIRLLQLPQDIKDALGQGKISASNARTLLSLPSEEERMNMFRAMLEGNLTVRQVEARIPHKRGPRKGSFADPNVIDAERRMRNALGMKVVVKRSPTGEGEIRVTFLNDEDLTSLVKKITGEM